MPVDAFHNLVCDEAHYLKNHSSLTFRQVAKVARRATNVALLTATPLLNHPEEMWTLLHLLYPQEYRSYWRWVHANFEVVTTTFRGRLDQPAHIIGDPLPERMSHLAASLSDVMIGREIEDLLGELPPLQHEHIYVTLSEEERAAYDDFERRMWLKLGKDMVVATNTVSKLVRARQLASEWSSFNEQLGLGTKLHAAVGLLDSLPNEQLVAFVGFRHSANKLVDELTSRGIRAVSFHGALTAAERQHALNEFRSGNARVLVGTFGVLGEGIDGLQVARNVALVDHDWTPARNAQAIARVHRQGQRQSVTAFHLVAENTVDEAVALAGERKSRLLNAILQRRQDALH